MTMGRHLGRGVVAAGIVELVLVGTGRAEASSLQVGPGKTYASPCAAIAAAHPGDEIDVAPGTYTDSCEINVPRLTVKGTSKRPTIDLSGTNHPADDKGIYVVGADDVRLENLELVGAHVDDASGGNAAALRVTGRGVVVHGCVIRDNQNGILAAPLVDGGTITIENTELSHNGLGDACVQAGCTHNVYISKNGAIRYDKTVFQFNWSHDVASDTADKGHLLKSRSRETDVLYNRLTGEGGHDSYEVDLPNAGLGIVLGNLIEKGPRADNSILIAYGEEGLDSGQGTTLYVASNTLVNDFTGGTFVRVATGTTLVAHDNVFLGPGALSSSGALSADNLKVAAAAFVNPAGYDYHLVAGAPAIGAAVGPGVAGSFSLTPAFEYVHPLGSSPRTTAHDLGAFEYGTVAAPPANDAGAGGSTGPEGGSDEGGSGEPPDREAATPPAEGSDASAEAHLEAGAHPGREAGSEAGVENASSSSDGCGCHLGGAAPRGPAALLAAGAAVTLALRRRGIKRSAE